MLHTRSLTAFETSFKIPFSVTRSNPCDAVPLIALRRLNIYFSTARGNGPGRSSRIQPCDQSHRERSGSMNAQNRCRNLHAIDGGVPCICNHVHFLRRQEMQQLAGRGIAEMPKLLDVMRNGIAAGPSRSSMIRIFPGPIHRISRVCVIPRERQNALIEGVSASPSTTPVSGRDCSRQTDRPASLDPIHPHERCSCAAVPRKRSRHSGSPT